MAPIPSTIHLPWKTRLQARIVALDFVLIAVSLAVAVYVRFGESPKSRLVGFAQLSYVETALLLGAGWLIALAAGSSYHLDVVGVGSEEYRKVTRATLLLFGAIAITATTFKIHFARGFLAIALPLGLALLLLGRLIHRRVLLRERIAGNYMAPALVVGSPVEVRYVVDLMRRQPFVGYAPVAVATASEEDFEMADGSTLPERWARWRTPPRRQPASERPSSSSPARARSIPNRCVGSVGNWKSVAANSHLPPG